MGVRNIKKYKTIENIKYIVKKHNNIKNVAHIQLNDVITLNLSFYREAYKLSNALEKEMQAKLIINE